MPFHFTINRNSFQNKPFPGLFILYVFYAYFCMMKINRVRMCELFGLPFYSQFVVYFQNFPMVIAIIFNSPVHL